LPEENHEKTQDNQSWASFESDASGIRVFCYCWVLSRASSVLVKLAAMTSCQTLDLEINSGYPRTEMSGWRSSPRTDE